MLFQYLNNEALDDDYKQRARVAQMVKKNNEDKELEIISLSTGQKITLSKAIYALNESIDDNLYGVKEGNRYSKVTDIGKIPLYYNNLSTLVRNYKLNTIERIEREKVYKQIDDLIPKLEEVYNLAIEGGAKDNYMIPIIIRNIRDRTFYPLVDVPVEIQQKYYKQKKPVEEEEEEEGEAPEEEGEPEEYYEGLL